MVSCNAVCVGNMRTRIIVQKPMMTPDGQGGFLPTEWINYFSFYGEVKWGKGGEKVVAQKVQNYCFCKIIAYFDPRLVEDMRILFNGKTLNVRDVSDLEERHQFMEISAEVGVGT